MFNVTLSNKAKKCLKDLHKSTKKIAERIDVILSDLENDPLPFKTYDIDKVESNLVNNPI